MSRRPLRPSVRFLQTLVHLLILTEDQLANVGAGASALTPDGNDSLNPAERETQALCLRKERQHGERLGRIEPVAGQCPARWRKNPRRLVDRERLAAGTTARETSPMSRPSRSMLRR